MKRTLLIHGQPVTVESVVREGDSVRFTLNGTEYRFHQPAADVIVGEHSHTLAIGPRLKDGSLTLAIDGQALTIGEPSTRKTGQGGGAASPLTRAPMTGTVQQVLVQVGDAVTPGSPLVVMEAMKLQLRLTAEVTGTVSAIETEAGALVSEGQVLVRLTPDTEQQPS